MHPATTSGNHDQSIHDLSNNDFIHQFWSGPAPCAIQNFTVCKIMFSLR